MPNLIEDHAQLRVLYQRAVLQQYLLLAAVHAADALVAGLMATPARERTPAASWTRTRSHARNWKRPSRSASSSGFDC